MADGEGTMKDVPTPRIYEDEGNVLMEAEGLSNRVILLPSGDMRHPAAARDRIRIQWGQHLLADVLSKCYRTVVCGVNPVDNHTGVISQLAELLPTSQWNPKSITSHAQIFSKSIGPEDVLVLKYDFDVLEVLALLRPHGREHFTPEDLEHGFRLVAEMTETRRDRLPVASVSFLGAKSNRLIDTDGGEPSFERVLRIMYEAGYRGDVYPSPGMWELAPTGVFASYPFPAGLDRMRSGGF